LAKHDGPNDKQPGELEILLHSRELRIRGAVFPLGGRAFDILRALVEASGAVVTKSDLMQRVWPDVPVSDNALQAHIFSIRRALRTNRTLLKTTSGLGYRLMGDWTVRAESDPIEPDAPPPPQALQEVRASGRQPVFRSGECEIDLAQRELRIRGTPTPIGSRSFDIIATLVQAANEIVTRDHLLERVWLGLIVGEGGIDVHMSAIRKALGPLRSILQTIPKRGFRLTGTWTVQGTDTLTLPSPSQPGGRGTNLPGAVTDLIGRDDMLAHLRQMCSAYRILTLAGPGGIGKTALAIELARSQLSDFDAGVWLVELASLTDPSLIPLAVAEAIGLQSPPGLLTPEAVARSIGHSRLLLVLDNCEHLIGAAARFAEVIIRLAPNAVILVTSRETLRIHGENVYRVPPLDVPENDIRQADELLGNSAVQLFMDRATALHIAGLREEQTLRLVAEVCRRLDGIPLALEFAAARAASLGVARIADGLEDRFALLTTGRRTALPRHQTLRAVFDWSYALLPDTERQLLHRLAIFLGGFSLDAACAVMPDSPRTEIADGIVSLVEKSIVIFDRSGPAGRWRLLETVRAYALDKLTVSGDHPATARRHTEYVRDFFAIFDPNADPDSGGDDLSGYAREVDNLRAGLAWAFSTTGDATLGVAVAVAAVNFWLAASLLDECGNWASKALAQPDGVGHAEQEMVLRSGLGQSLMFTQGMTPATHANLTRALFLAEAIGSIEHQKRAVHGLWQIALRSLELRRALQLSQRYAELARNDPDVEAARTANLMAGMSLVYLAEYVEASRLLERAVHDYSVARRTHDMGSYGINARASAFGHLSPCLLSRGLIDAAIRAAEQSIEAARQVGQPVAVCLALARPAAHLFPEIGAFDTAERHFEAMLEQADRHALPTFRGVALCAKGRVLFMRGDPDAGVAALRSGLAHFAATGYRSFQTPVRGYFAEALTAAGHADEGLAEVEAALLFAEQTDYMHYVPQLLCVYGRLIALRQPDDPAAEQIFKRAINLSHQQQALYWELRAALSLAECWDLQGRRGEAQALLAPICQRFTEGFETPVLVRANALLRAAERGV
jgi:non-specific serine/threonine protein kinase